MHLNVSFRSGFPTILIEEAEPFYHSFGRGVAGLCSGRCADGFRHVPWTREVDRLSSL